MYGDDYKPNDPIKYADIERYFDTALSRDDLSLRLVMVLSDTTASREDVHVLHKRTCLQKGWE